MFEMILVPVDGSRFAEAALPHARRLAREVPARLRLVMAHHVLPAWNPAIGFPDGGAALEEETRQRETRYLEALAKAVAAESGRPVDWALLNGAPGDAIVQDAQDSGAGLIVMATHGRGPASRFWLGSTTDYVLRHVGVPLLAVRPPEQGEDGGRVPSIRRILVPTDGSALSESVVEPVAEFAHCLQATVLLLTVVEPVIGTMDPALPFPATVDPAIADAQRADAQARLEALAGRLRARGLVVETRVVVALGVGASILEVLEQEADMVAMSTHGQGGLRRALIGSVTDKVIRGAQKPVLAWRPRLVL